MSSACTATEITPLFGHRNGKGDLVTYNSSLIPIRPPPAPVSPPSSVIELNEIPPLSSPSSSSSSSSGSSESAGPDCALAKFDSLLTRIQPESIIALALRTHREWSIAPSAGTVCTLVSPPLCGSYNLIHVLDFNDGIKWVLRLPLKDPGSRRLQSEIMTMHFIRKYTTIPIPDIISFDSTTENEIASPYTIMQFNDGTPVCQIWWDESGPTPLEERRHRILDTVASAMSQLTQFKFNKIGCLEFEGDTRSHLVSSPKIGPLNIEQEEEIRQQEAEHNGAIFKGVGPFDSSREYLTSLLDAQIIEDDSFAIGMNRLLRMMVESLPLSRSIVESLPLSRSIVESLPLSRSIVESLPLSRSIVESLPLSRSIVESLPLSRSMTENESFVLTHPDFGGQNFLVAEDGTLTAIIDWDNVQTVPQWIGCRSYPAWLTRDWDPLMYGYPEAERENSPEELDAYRKYYAGRMASLGSAQFTTKSHIYEAIYNASSSPACADSIIDKIFHHLFPVEDNDDNYNPDTPDLGEVVEALAEESLEEHVENKVLSSIQELLSLPEETPTTTVTRHLSTGKTLWRFLRKWTGATLIFALSLIPKWSGILNFFRNARPRTDVSIGRRRV